MTNYNPMLNSDFYKQGHINQYPEGTEVIYSSWTPRTSRIKGIDKVVMFGLQGFIKKYLIEYWNINFFKRPKEEVVNEFSRLIKHTLGKENPDTSHVEELYDLGYLPIEIRALKEGTLVPLRVPMLTIHNTRPDLVSSYWVTNFLETVMSSELWQPMTIATLSHAYRQILDRYAMETVGNTDHVPFQAHDFSFRGMAGLEASAQGGAGHLLSFVGTDTIPAIMYHEKYYNANIENELVGTSIPATEHSVACANTDPDTRDEMKYFNKMLDEYRSGFVSIVSDTYDFWKVVGEILPALKDRIMNRDGRVVIRPDSGNPVDIICGKYIVDLTEPDYPDMTPLEASYDYFADKLREMDLCGDGYSGDSRYTFKFKYKDKYYTITLDIEYNRHDRRYYYIETVKLNKLRGIQEFEPALEDLGLIESLWNIFGGTVNALGYKVLDPHIGAIYGDSITLERAEAICAKLKEKGFASSNIVFGVGSFTFQYNTRDTFGFAMKATYAVIDGEEKLLYKDPKTDDGTKRSQRGLVTVFENTDGNLTFLDGFNEQGLKEFEMACTPNLLEPVFKNGKLIREQSLAEIREILAGA
jgi:nicotinamide phosphoribosyltransferase